MHRVVAGLLGLILGIASVSAGVATAQDGGSPATVVELPQTERGGRGQDGREVARGDDGDSITYTIVESPEPNAGDATTAVSPPAAPDLSRVPVPADSGETTVAPPTGEPASVPVAGSPEAGIVGDATTVDPGGQTAPPAVSCLDFGSWYDAQVYYESAGGLTAAAELVSALDADVDGVACEELIVYS